MDKRNAKLWYVGVAHVLTSYVTAGIFTFITVFILTLLALLLSFSSRSLEIYMPLLSSLVFIPILLFPATKYSIKFITNRYVVSDKEQIIRYALISIALLKIIIDWVSFTSLDVASVISFLLSIVVFYGVSVKWMEVNEGKDGFDLKDIRMSE